MTKEQAISFLTERYGAVDSPKDNVFVARVPSGFEMFRLEDGALEKRIDVDFHTVKWEVVE